jgi:hypothetical protein
MEVEHKSQAEAGSYSKDPNAELDAALEKNYVGMRFQQGKPILDRELNLLGALSNSRRLAQWYIGNGVPDGDDGFLISNVMIDANDFTIKKGRCLVNGYEVVLDADTTYQKQPLINETLDFNFADGSESVYDVHLHVDTREVSSVQDPALQNDGDIGFETALREKVVWKVLVTKTGTLTDQQMTDLCLLARVDTRKATPDAQRVTDQRITGITLAKIQQNASKPTEDMTLRTLKVRERLDVGAPPAPPSTGAALDAASKVATALFDATAAIGALYDAVNTPEILAFQASLQSAPETILQSANTTKTATIAARAAVDGAAGGDAAQVSAAARASAEQGASAVPAVQSAAAQGKSIAQWVTQAAAGNNAAVQQAKVVGEAAATVSQYAVTLPQVSAAAVKEANALDAATVSYNVAAAADPQAKLSVGGDTLLRGRVAVAGSVGVGVAVPRAALHVAGGNKDLAATEGDFKIGNDTVRLKIGVDLDPSSSSRAVRVRADGASLILGSGQSDVLTIREQVAMTGPPLVAINMPMMSPDPALTAADASVAAGKGVLQAATTARDTAKRDIERSGVQDPNAIALMAENDRTLARIQQSVADADAAAARARAKSKTPGDVPPEVTAAAKATQQAVSEGSRMAGMNMPVRPSKEFSNAVENLAMRNNDASKAADAALAQANELAKFNADSQRAKDKALADAAAVKPRVFRSTFLSMAGELSVKGNVGIGIDTPNYGLHVGSGKSVRYELGAGSKLSLGGNGTLEVDAPGVVGGRLIVTDSGSVGIGTTKPGQKLDVAGSIQLSGVRTKLFYRGDSDSHIGSLAFYSPDGGNTAIITPYDSAGDNLSTSTIRFGGFGSFDTNKVNLTASGNVGIGLANPSARLDIQGGADSNGNNDPKALAFSYRTGGFRHWIRTRHNSAVTASGAGSGNAFDFYVNNSVAADGSTAPGAGCTHALTLESGFVGIGRTDPQVPLHIRQPLSNHGIIIDEADASGKLTGRGFRIHYEGQGNIVFYHQDGKGQWMGPGGTWNFNSDLSLKDQVSPMSDVLERVMRLKPVNFVWKDDQTPDMGFVAQDVEQVFPEIVCSVNQDGRDVKGLPYTSFGVFAIAAIQELKNSYDEKIRALEEKLASLAQRD